MKKFLLATAVSLSLVVNSVAAIAPVVVTPTIIPPPPHSGAWSAGAAGATGFIAFVAALAGYDLIRRWTCSGDFLHLGGPGFTEPMPKVGNVKAPPYCGFMNIVKKKQYVIHNK